MPTDGVGPPLVTPFTAEGDLDEAALRDLVGWIEDDVDFLVPCGSNGEAELMTSEERARTIEIVADAADVPVLAGTGHPGFEETRQATERAADVGADAALVVTPFYFTHDDAALEAYYRQVADASPIPVYLYSVPKYTGVTLAPEVVGRLAEHPNVAGMKDSSGDLAAFSRTRRLTRDADFRRFVGTASVLAYALDAGADGGVLALANVAPAACSEVYRRHRAGDHEAAHALNADLVEPNRQVTAVHGVPGLKAAMRSRGAAAGHPRPPHRPVDEATEGELADLFADLA